MVEFKTGLVKSPVTFAEFEAEARGRVTAEPDSGVAVAFGIVAVTPMPFNIILPISWVALLKILELDDDDSVAKC
jgi:hypothetical protein